MGPNLLKMFRRGSAEEPDRISVAEGSAPQVDTPDYAGMGKAFLQEIGIPEDVMNSEVTLFRRTQVLSRFLEDEECRKHMLDIVKTFIEMQPKHGDRYETYRETLREMVMTRAVNRP